MTLDAEQAFSVDQAQVNPPRPVTLALSRIIALQGQAPTTMRTATRTILVGKQMPRLGVRRELGSTGRTVRTPCSTVQ